MATTGPTRVRDPPRSWAAPSAPTSRPPSCTRTPSAAARASSPPRARSSSGPASTPVARPRTSSSSASQARDAKIWWGAVNRPICEAALRTPAGAPGRIRRHTRPVQPGLLHRRGAGPPPLTARLHRDGLGQHLRPQPVPPTDRRAARRLRAELHDHLRPVVPGRSPRPRGPAPARRSWSTSSGWR